MASQVTNFQCPSCTGPLHFDGESGKLVCDYCGSSFTVHEIEALYQDKLDQAAQSAQTEANASIPEPQPSAPDPEGDWDWNTMSSWDEEQSHLICEETTVATSCPYCGNPTVVPGQFTGMLKPDFILPFKRDKEAAVQALRKFYKGKKLLPKKFSEENHIEEIKGVYVPFWLFDGTAEADMEFSATRSRSYTQGNKRITETDHFRVHRRGTVSFHRIPVDGSRKMPDALMDAIEPFDYNELKSFSAAYLPGFLAEKYDVDSDECEQRANRRAANTTEEIVRNSVTGYSTVSTLSRNIDMMRGEVKYALIPVWLLTTKWHDQLYYFAMNGQTGKLIGDLPSSTALYWSWFARIAVPIAAVVGAVMHFFF